MNDAAQPSSAYLAELVGLQMRNMQALSTAQQQLFDGFSMLARQQAQVMQSSLRLAFAAGAAASPSDLRGFMGARIDDLKSSITDAQANANMASEIMAHSLGEAATTMQARMMSALDEIKSLVEKAVPADVPLKLPRAGA